MPFAWNNRASISAVLCSAVIVLGIAGCGGKSDTSSTDTSTGTKTTAPARSGGGQVGSAAGATASTKQFIAQADEICGRANAAIARSEAKAKAKIRKPEVHARLIAQNQEAEETAIKELAKLKPPKDLAGAWQKMSLYRQALARQLGVFATATQLHISNLSQLIASKKKLHFELRDAARKAGFKDCAKVG